MFRSILAEYPSVALNTRRIPCHPLPLYNPPPCIYIPVKFAASKDSLEPSEIEPLYLNQLLSIPMSSPSSNLELGELIGIAAPGKAGLMSGSYGLLPRMDINDANKLYNGFAKISTGCLNVPNGFNGYLIAFSPDLYIVVQIAINSNGSQMFLRSNWDGWRSWYQVI